MGETVRMDVIPKETMDALLELAENAEALLKLLEDDPPSGNSDLNAN